MTNNSPWLELKLVKIVPHIVDTVLIITAIILSWQIKQYPFADDWLTAKVLALLVYIGFGMIALHYGKTKRQKILAFVLAVATYSYILAVAMTRTSII